MIRDFFTYLESFSSDKGKTKPEMLKKDTETVNLPTAYDIYLSENLRFKKIGNKLLICY